MIKCAQALGVYVCVCVVHACVCVCVRVCVHNVSHKEPHVNLVFFVALPLTEDNSPSVQTRITQNYFGYQLEQLGLSRHYLVIGDRSHITAML